MKARRRNPHHQRETAFTGLLQEFSGRALSPDDPSLEPRVRKGRPVREGATEEKKKKTRKRKSDRNGT